MVCRANGFIDGFFVFCACIEVHVYVPTSSQPASQPVQLHRKFSSSWIVHDRISTVCSKVVNTTQRRTCIHAFQVVFQYASKVFQQALFGVLPGIFLSLSFFLSAARSLYLALAPSLCSFITSRLLGPCFLSWLES